MKSRFYVVAKMAGRKDYIMFAETMFNDLNAAKRVSAKLAARDDTEGLEFKVLEIPDEILIDQLSHVYGQENVPAELLRPDGFRTLSVFVVFVERCYQVNPIGVNVDKNGLITIKKFKLEETISPPIKKKTTRKKKTT